jgi:hypothetical protein
MSGRASSALLIIAAIVCWATGIFLLSRDVVRTIRSKTAEPEAKRLATEAIQVVENPDSGWFPYSRDPAFDFEDGEQGWALDDTSMVYQKETLTTVEDSVGACKHALSIPVHFPDPATIIRSNKDAADHYKLQGVRYIAYDVKIPRECKGFVGCLFFMKDKDGLWYQARSRTALLPGRWTTVTADIRGGSPDVIPLGHLGQWDENQASRVETVGITFYGDREFTGRVRLSNIRAWMRAPRFEKMVDQLGGAKDPVSSDRIKSLQDLKKRAENYTPPELRMINLRTDPAAQPGQESPIVKRFDTFTLRFEMNREADNPFDPESADITCTVTSPSGKTSEHIGFWYQDYDREDHFIGDELKPMGRPEWRVRITPREAGKYTYVIHARLQKDTVETKPASFVCEPSDQRGFVKVSHDPRYFEFENGDFYYPIGHNLHSPVDIRCWKEIFKQEPQAGRGLNMYADFFDKMKQAGENTAEVWMSSWWVGIEWTSAWPDYYGPGRYSLQNAWKLDTLLKMAREHGLNVHLVLDNHGKFSEFCDWEWDLNPYNRNADSRGCVTGANEFFTNQRARALHRNRLRYIAARWGPDPTIMGWELVSEFDLVGGKDRNDMNARNYFHRSQIPRDWAHEMINYMRTVDVYRHLITIHYATNYSFVDLNLAQTPLFDYVVTDAYRADPNYTNIAMNTQSWASNNLFKAGASKPFWVTEFGGDWNATTAPALEADFYCGPWATWMTEAGGTPMFWWYDFVDRNNLYRYMHAFSNYAKGEDRRGINGNPMALLITGGNPNGTLSGYGFLWNTGGYGWLFTGQAMMHMPPADRLPHYTGVVAQIQTLEPGKYVCEFWDCFEGKIVSTETTEIQPGHVFDIHFPPFTCNMAFKIKKQPAK